MIHIHVIDKGKGLNEDGLDSEVNFGLSPKNEKLELMGGTFSLIPRPGKEQLYAFRYLGSIT